MRVLPLRPGLFRTRSLRRRAIIAAVLWLAAIAALAVGAHVAVFGASTPAVALGVPLGCLVAVVVLIALAVEPTLATLHGRRLAKEMPLGRYFATAPNTRLPGRHHRLEVHAPTVVQPVVPFGVAPLSTAEAAELRAKAGGRLVIGNDWTARWVSDRVSDGVA